MPPRGRPANSGRGRMRVDRAMAVENSSAGEVIDKIRDSIGEIIDITIAAAKEGDEKARAAVLNLAEDDIYRARSGQASDILLALAKVREKGSKINESTWSKLVKSVVEATGSVT